MTTFVSVTGWPTNRRRSLWGSLLEYKRHRDSDHVHEARSFDGWFVPASFFPSTGGSHRSTGDRSEAEARADKEFIFFGPRGFIGAFGVFGALGSSGIFGKDFPLSIPLGERNRAEDSFVLLLSAGGFIFDLSCWDLSTRESSRRTPAESPPHLTHSRLPFDSALRSWS